jgi:hypothetical protein
MLSNILYWSGILVPISGIQEPGSGENLFRIPDPGVKKAPDPGSVTLLPTSLFPPTPEFCIPVLTCPDEDDADSVQAGVLCFSGWLQLALRCWKMET